MEENGEENGLLLTKGSESDSEDFMQGVKGASYKEFKQGSAGSPVSSAPIAYPTELNTGDHILFQEEKSADPPLRPLFQSALVTGPGDEKRIIKIISYSRGGIYEDDVDFDTLKSLHKVEYTSCRYSAKKSVSRARWRLKAGEDHYHTLFNNSHFFVTCAKTGNEYLLYDIIDCLTVEEGIEYPLNPVLSHSAVTALTDITAGDHVILNSHHYLVHSTDPGSDTFKAFTVRGGKVVEEEKGFGNKDSSTSLLRVDYDQQSNAYHPGRAIEDASKEVERKSKWESSDSFVTMMKCGRRHVLSPKCLLPADLEPCGCTCVTPHIAVDVGDHLIVRGTFGDYHSVLIYNCVNRHTVVSMPSLHRRAVMGSLNLLDYNEVYRVNYPRSLPVEEVLRRACSPEGEKMLMEEGGGAGDAANFISWAKIGRQVSVNVSKLIGKQQVALIRPTEYEKVLSVQDIQVGDHLFLPNLAYRWHFLVTELPSPDKWSEPVFGTVYCLRGSVKETGEKIDPVKDDVFKILYPEEFPPSLAVSRARSLLGKVNLSPTARMWFVRWAKTGSEEGLEIDFLKRKTLPVSKSRVVCFTQLDPGDYLVQDKGRFFVRRHFLVVSVESATACTVIGAWKGRVQESRLNLEDGGTYHRIIHEEGVCVPPEKSIARAREAMRAPFVPKLFRRKFVNYIKTTDSVEVDVENLPEHRLLLQRERLDSVAAADLRPGDHLEMPVKTFQGVSYQDMIVTDVLGPPGKVMVLRVREREGKQRLLEEELEVCGGGGGEEKEEVGEMYRVKYLERVDVREGLEIVRRSLGSIVSKDNADLLMLATVGQALSTHVDLHLHKVLQCRKQDVRRQPSVSRVRQASLEVGGRVSANAAFKLGTRVVLHGTRLGRVVGYGPGINLLIEAPFFTRRLYKLNRQKKFDQISQEEYTRGVIQQSFTSANTVVGATAGAIVGQIAIPVPVLGAAVGGALGTISGHGLGRLEGWAASKLVRDPKSPTLPVVVTLTFVDYPEI